MKGRKNMKLVLTDCSTVTNGDIDLHVLDRFGEVVYYPLSKPEELIERLTGADAMVCNKTNVTAEIMEACPTLKYIGLWATGYNNIDVDYAGKHGVTVCNAGQYSTNAVAQHTFALILELFSSISRFVGFTADGGWQRSASFSSFVFPQREVFGKTIGIVGYGSIGKAVAKIALAFGMKVLVNTRTPQNDPAVTFVSFDELLKNSDVVTLHCPLTPQTTHLMDESAFKKMKNSAIFINTSRGGAVDEAALRAALENGEIAGAGIDVLTTEPMSLTTPLAGAPNIVITPHVAWSPLETRQRLLGIVVDCLDAWVAGKPFNVVS